MKRLILSMSIATIFMASCENRLKTSTDRSLDTGVAEIKPALPVKDLRKEIAALKPFFKYTKDEFSNYIWVKSKTEPRYRNQNGVFCYFALENDTAKNLRFVIQYASEDWLFIRNYVFSIDGKVFNYVPDKVETDNGVGGIWEWSDESVSPELADILVKIIYSKSAKIKLNGSQYYDVKTISAKQKNEMRRILKMYRLNSGDQLIGYDIN